MMDEWPRRRWLESKESASGIKPTLKRQRMDAGGQCKDLYRSIKSFSRELLEECSWGTGRRRHGERLGEMRKRGTALMGGAGDQVDCWS